MAGDEDPSSYVLRVPLIPLTVAEELPRLLIAIRNRSRDLERTGSQALQTSEGFGGMNLDVTTNLILEDLDHYLKLAMRRGQQVSAVRWEGLLQDLRSLKRKLDAQQ
jgi:hypothetical protein